MKKRCIWHLFQNQNEHQIWRLNDDESELGDLEGEEEAPIKWRDYNIKTLIVIYDEIERKSHNQPKERYKLFSLND